MTLFNAEGKLINLPLATKRGEQIPNEQREQAIIESMEARRELVLKGRLSARVRSLSSTYNCMGMVFASRRTWIEPEHVAMILQDDGYRPVSDEDELYPGDVVIYRDNRGEVSHVGIVTDIRINLIQASREITVLSQWGESGEYLHLVDDVHPGLGQPSEYWTERIQDGMQ